MFVTKRVYELCSSGPRQNGPDPKTQSKYHSKYEGSQSTIKNLSGGDNFSPHQVPKSENWKSGPSNMLEGLEILNISPEQFAKEISEKTLSTSDRNRLLQSNSRMTEYSSPAMMKRGKGLEKEGELLWGIDELEGILREKDLDVNKVVEVFKRMIER